MVVIPDPSVNTSRGSSVDNGSGDSCSDGDDTDDIISPELIPLKLDYNKKWVQGVKINYNAFPFELRFAITYHKVQGQTMDKVILFLHERTSRQLAPLQWESLYVAYTRVQNGKDIRVCFSGSDKRSGHRGLEYLKKLQRPALYDLWQRTYNKQGIWDDTNIRFRARKERTQLRRKLQRITSIETVSLKKLKHWANILDVVVPYKSGTNRKNKPQYVEAIKPIWVGINGGVLLVDGYKPEVVHQRRSTSTRSYRLTSGQHNNNVDLTSTSQVHTKEPATAPPISDRQLSIVTRARTGLHVIFNRYPTRTNAMTQMRRRSYCIDLPYVNECSQWSAYTLATPGEFICDTTVFYFTSLFCEGNNRLCVIDPIFPIESSQLFRKGIRDCFLRRLHDEGQTLLFPLNVPEDVHWVIVFVWVDTSGRVVIQCRNSMRTFRRYDSSCCRRVEEFLRRLYNDQSGRRIYRCPIFISGPQYSWTEQTPNLNACALHVISQVYLASKGVEHTHIFDNEFVEQIRKYCLTLWYSKRCRRVTTYMRPIDLTQDDPRFNGI